MRRDGAAIALAGAALLLWAGLIAGPLAWLYLAGSDAPARSVGPGSSGKPADGARPGPSATVPLAVAWRTFAIAAALAAGSVLLGYVPGQLLGTAQRGGTVLFFLLLAPLLLPQYLSLYAWDLLRSPTTPLGDWLSSRPGLAVAAGAATSSLTLVLWYWPLAGLIIAQGFRSMDRDVQQSAMLEAGPARRFAAVTLPQLAPALLLAFGLCFVMVLSEFATFHLAGMQTLGTALAVVYAETGSTAAVARSAWPAAVPAAVVAVALWRRSADWSTQTPLAAPDPPARPAWRWAMLAGLLALTIGGPVGLLAASLRDGRPLADFYALHREELGTSLLAAAVAAAAGLAMAGGSLVLERQGRTGRAAACPVQATMLLAALLPGSLVAAALVHGQAVLRAHTGMAEGWWSVSAGLTARLAGIQLVLLRLGADARSRHLSELAATDGASRAQTWWHVHLPMLWQLPAAAMLLGTMLGLVELPATTVLLPAGVPNFAQSLLNQMHYARDQQVIATCLVLVGVYAALAGGAVAARAVMVRGGRRGKGRGGGGGGSRAGGGNEVGEGCRAGENASDGRKHGDSADSGSLVRVLWVVLTLCSGVGLGACAGCDGARSGVPKVVRSFGQTGRGPGEFLYPRAIDRAADGTLWVIDKTGRVQHLDTAGAYLGGFAMPLTDTGKPTGFSIGPDGNLYIADTHYHRVMVYSPAGKLLRQWGSYGQGPGEFIYPTDVAFAPDGRLFVSEYGGNDRVSIFSAAGEFLGSFGSLGDGTGQFSRPSALQVDAARGRLYVADACNHRIAVYDLQGKLQRYFGSVGREAGQLRYPYGLALTKDGRLVVCEFGNNRLQVLDPAGRSLAVLGGPGRQLGELAFPWAVAVDGRGLAYIIDAGNNRVQVWELP
jgi:ABC-type Fe3+ transport system permease subunit/DNA-binding beta-propeller fold protein YncE